MNFPFRFLLEIGFEARDLHHSRAPNFIHPREIQVFRRLAFEIHRRRLTSLKDPAKNKDPRV